MPELPEVEAVCRRLRKDAVGSRIIAARVMRPIQTKPQTPAHVAKRVANHTIDAVRRRGKNILVDLSDGLTLHVHPRMTGNLYVIADHRLRPVAARAWFELEDGRAMIYEDRRVLGRIQVHPTSEMEERLEKTGVEPLEPGFTEETLIALARKSGQPVKVFLMDQRHLAGLGNIYAAEALFEAKINPRRVARQLSRARLKRLHAAIVGVLERAVQSACIAYMHPDRFQEAEWFPVEVYDRAGERCRRCSKTIRRIEQGGRSTYFCPGCQT